MSSDSDNACSIRHHTHKRRKIVISDSSDSSDESIIVHTRRKKKILRVVSEGESSSDDSDVPKPVIRRQNHRVISEDESNYNSSAEGSKQSTASDSSSTSSEWQSDWTSSSDESNEDTKKYSTKRKILSKTKSENAEKPGSSSSSINVNANSSDSDDQSEKCPICLLPFRKQQIGTPSACDHSFCLECLVEWSKNINTCPVDRITFTTIAVKEHFDGKVLNQLPVEAVPRLENPVLDDPTFCEICHQSDREDRMLLCDSCDRGYHMECLTPPMTTVPIEEWYCPTCTRNSHSNNSTRSYLSSFVPTLITTGRNPSQLLRDIRRDFNIFRNIIPHVNDRTYVPARRNRRMHEPMDVIEQFIDPNQPSTSSGLDSIGDNSRSRSPNTSLEGNASSSRSKMKSKIKTKTVKKKKKKITKNSKKSGGSNLVREVRIKEFNNDGEEEEIVTYVKVASATSRRKCKKRTKKTRKV